MLRLMMAGRSYANVPTSDATDKHANSHIPLQNIPQHTASTNMNHQGVPNGSVPVSQDSIMTTFGPETPPRNPTSNPTYNPGFQSQGIALERIPQSPDYTKDKENPYEELPNNYEQAVQPREYVQYHGIDGEGPKLYGAPYPPADNQQFLRLDSTLSSTSTDQIVKDRLTERAPRKKRNPTYEIAPFQTENISNENRLSEAKDPSKHHSCECVKTYFFIILIFMLALVALLLVVLVISGTLQTGAMPGQSDSVIGDKTTAKPGPTLDELQHRIDQLETANQALLDRFVELEQLLGSGSENATVSVRLAQNTLKIEELTKNVTEHDEALVSLDNDVRLVTIMAQNNKNSLADLEEKTTATDNRLLHVTYQVGNLTQQVISTDATHTNQIGDLQDASSQQDSRITGLDDQFNNFEATFTATLGTMNQSIYEELDTISKMPGPRGYNGSRGEPGEDGVGDLTQCSYTRYSGGSGFISTPTTTAWKGQGVIATGVSCSTDGGETQNLEHRASSGYDEYRCSCEGGSGSGTRSCYMDMWSCPNL